MNLGIEHKNTMTDGELIRELCQIIQKLSNRIDDKDLEIKRLKQGIEMRDNAIKKMKPIYADTDSVKIQGGITRSFRIRKDLGTRLDDYSEWSHIPKTVIVELALEEYLNKVAPVKKTAKSTKK